VSPPPGLTPEPLGRLDRWDLDRAHVVGIQLHRQQLDRHHLAAHASAYGSGRPADWETMSGRAWRIYLAGGMAAVALSFLLPLGGLWSSLAYDLIGLSSVAAILVARERHTASPD
jgi:hypothetical protein